MYQRLQFGADGRAFVRFQLSKGPTLGGILCRKLAIEHGSVTAFLPPTVTSWDLMHFAWPINSIGNSVGNLIDWEYRDREYSLVANYLEKGVGRAALFYATTKPPPGIQPSVHTHEQVDRLLLEIVHPENDLERIVSTEVYFVLESPLAKKEALQRAMKPGSSTLIAVLASPGTSSRNWPGVSGEMISKDTLEFISSHTEMVLVSAYDRDATLVWSRSESP